MKLKEACVGKTDCKPYETLSAVIDEDIDDTTNGQIVALILYSPGGNLIYWHRTGYNAREVMAWGERVIGESLNRYKEYDCKVRK